MTIRYTLAEKREMERKQARIDAINRRERIKKTKRHLNIIIFHLVLLDIAGLVLLWLR